MVSDFALLQDLISSIPFCQEQGGQQKVPEMTPARYKAQDDLFFRAVFLLGVKLGKARLIENEKESYND